MRKLVLAGVCTVALALGGCGKKAQETTAPTATASLDATPENAPGTTLSEATVQLPTVPGNPGVAYFTLSQGSGPARKLVAVHVDGVDRAEMHESSTKNGVATMAEVTEVPLAPGKAVEFGPGGYHVMLFGVTDTLKAGGVTELTITLDNGDKASVQAKVDAIGGSMDHMDHM